MLPTALGLMPLSAIVVLLGSLSQDVARQDKSPKELPKIPAPDPNAAEVPAGYRVEVAVDNLMYPTSVELDGTGGMFVAEGGYMPGDTTKPARVFKITATGTKDQKREIAADQLSGPITDLLWHEGRLFISHKGKISVLEQGKVRDLVTGLPSLGDHSNNQMAVGPDGKIYFGQGSATSSGVVGADSFAFGWPKQNPEVCETTAKDITLGGEVFATPDPRNEAKTAEAKTAEAKTAEGTPADSKAADAKAPDSKAPDRKDAAEGAAPAAKGNAAKGNTVKTSAYQPFGKSVPAGTVVKGVTKANGTILRMDSDGSNVEVYAWGFRNPYGITWGPDRKLYVADAGSDERGSRPIANAPEKLWLVNQGSWYGWPDFEGGVPVTDARFKPKKGPAPQLVLQNHPPVEKPLMTLDLHSSITQMDVSRGAKFGFAGQVFLAASGDQSAVTAAEEVRAGYWVKRIDLASGKAEMFFRTKQSALGPKGLEYVVTAGPKRLVDVRFSPQGDALYVVDIGPLHYVAGPKGPQPQPYPNTGVVWRISRAQ